MFHKDNLQDKCMHHQIIRIHLGMQGSYLHPNLNILYMRYHMVRRYLHLNSIPHCKLDRQYPQQR